MTRSPLTLKEWLLAETPRFDLSIPPRGRLRRRPVVALDAPPDAVMQPPASRYPMSTQQHLSQRPKAVIVGAGFGGIEAARALARPPGDVPVSAQNNHHGFHPLLTR